jgi:hypothetical protein
MANTTEIIDAAKSLGGCKPQESAKMASFFSDPDNTQAIAEAYDKFGGYPPANRQSYHTGVGFLGKWHDFCDYQPIYDFYNYAKIAVDFPKITAMQSNCYQIKSALVGLEAVKANALNKNDASILNAIETKISEYNAIYASLACDQYILNQEKSQLEAATLREQQAAAALQADAFDKASGNTPTTGSKTGTYVLYGFVGLSAIVFLTVILKKD